MPADMHALAGDLTAESAVLRDMIADLDEDGWQTPTPAEGWSIGDQTQPSGFLRRRGDPVRDGPRGIRRRDGASGYRR